MNAPFCSIIQVLFKLLFIPGNFSRGLMVNNVIYAFLTSISKNGVKVKVRGGLSEIKVVVRIGDGPAVVPAFK